MRGHKASSMNKAFRMHNSVSNTVSDNPSIKYYHFSKPAPLPQTPE
jgi:hypothetical protein